MHVHQWMFYTCSFILISGVGIFLYVCLFLCCVSSAVNWPILSFAHFSLESLWSYLRISIPRFLETLCSKYDNLLFNFEFRIFFYNVSQYLFIYLWLSWVFVAVHGLSLVVASGGYSSLRCAGFSLRWLLLLRSTGSRHEGFSSCGTWAQ